MFDPIYPLIPLPCYPLLFFFNDPPTTEIYTLSLHDALPIFGGGLDTVPFTGQPTIANGEYIVQIGTPQWKHFSGDRKSTRLNSSHVKISYAVFCLKKKKKYKKEL